MNRSERVRLRLVVWFPCECCKATVVDNVWIVIPAFNEATSIGRVLRAVKPYGWQVVVIDDGSTDGTSQEALMGQAHVCRHMVNLGQGAALQTGIQYALRRGAKLVVTYDADDQHRAEDVPDLLRALTDGGYDVALGTRFAKPESVTSIPPSRRLLLRLATLYTRWTVGVSVTDTHNGLRAFTADAARKLKIVHNRMSHATEILCQVRAHGMRYIEVPVCIRYTGYSLGKGQKLTDAFSVLWDSLAGLLRT